jgi:hypothetical protein
MEKTKNTYGIFVGKLLLRGLHGKPRKMWENSTKKIIMLFGLGLQP